MSYIELRAAHERRMPPNNSLKTDVATRHSPCKRKSKASAALPRRLAKR